MLLFRTWFQDPRLFEGMATGGKVYILWSPINFLAQAIEIFKALTLHQMTYWDLSFLLPFKESLWEAFMF